MLAQPGGLQRGAIGLAQADLLREVEALDPDGVADDRVAVPAAAVIGVLVRFAIAQYRLSPLYRGSGASGPDS